MRYRSAASNRNVNTARLYRASLPIKISCHLVLVCSLLAVPQAIAEGLKKPAPLPIEQMWAVAYTKAFAKRFALPDPEAGTEPEGGIEAMEFAVEPGIHGNTRFYCKLYLYLDSKLPVAFPEEAVRGKDYIPSQRTRLMTFDAQTRWLRLSEEDRLHFGERQSRYNAMTWLATPDYPGYFEEKPKKPYAAVGMFYEEYHRDLFPGLAYLKIDMGCPAYSWVDKVDVVQVWLKREGGKDYRKQLRKDPADFLKFTIPSGFYRQIVQWTKQAAAHNRQLLEKQQRKSKETTAR